MTHPTDISPDLDEHELIYDWNSVEKVAPLSPRRRIKFFDETLRDGIQSPSVVDPAIDDKIRLVDLADSLGVDSTDIGLPGAGKRADRGLHGPGRAHPRLQAEHQGRLRRADPP